MLSSDFASLGRSDPIMVSVVDFYDFRLFLIRVPPLRYISHIFGRIPMHSDDLAFLVGLTLERSPWLFDW